MSRFDLSDFEWSLISPLLPQKSRGVKRVDDRRVLNGIFFKFRTGIPWRDLPERYGPYTTVYNRFNRWVKAGIWDDLMDAICGSYPHNLVMVDGTSIRVHHAAATVKKNSKLRCMGRSRGGLTTKLHVIVNEHGLAIDFALTPGQDHDAPVCRKLLRNLQPGQTVLADKAYDADWIRNMIREQGAIDCIPSKSNRKRPKLYDKELYKQRNIVERFFGRLKKSFRSIATRYECKTRDLI